MSATDLTIHLHKAVNGWQANVYDDGSSSFARAADRRMNAATLADALEWVAIEAQKMAAPKPQRKKKRTA